ncbi:MAG TPA: type II secretion system protein [Thermoanaerobaculia bacterium]|nr:type II secretion system protein [Thermoanaerobaculia bacterium]
MRRHGRRGAGLLELVVAMAVFGVFLLILTSLAAEYRRLDRGIRFGWFIHPDDMAVATRMRRDVNDSVGYPESFGDLEQTPTTLLLSGQGARTIVWTFSDDAVRRDEWKGNVLVASWTARATRRFEIGAWSGADGSTGVHLVGKTAEGRVIVDRLFVPRPR